MAGNKAKSHKQRKAHHLGRKRRKTKNITQGYSLTRLSGLGLAACIASALPVWFFNSSYYGAKSYSTKPDYVSKVFKHDSNAFTQGFAVGKRVDAQTGLARSVYYESTGLFGHSSLREIDVTSGKVLRQVSIEKEFFGEGITVLGNRIVMLTWQSRRGFIYDADSFERQAIFPFKTTTGEGWGITYDSATRLLVVSDGSSFLHFWDPNALPTARQVKRVEVLDEKGEPVPYLNELEYVQGEILANIWYQDRIARIDPATGVVVGWLQLDGLIDPYRNGKEDVLNGIAYDPARPDSLYVTGKKWPRTFELRNWR